MTVDEMLDTRLTSLAVKLGDKFLREREETKKHQMPVPNTIHLNDDDPEVLNAFREKMQAYFESQGPRATGVTVEVGGRGYMINVRYFLG